MRLGTSFDFEQAEKFHLDYKKCLERIKKLNLSLIRIGVKWSRVEYKKEKYHWSEYDDIFATLEEYKIPTILQVGMKSPQWPEFYIPNWLNLDLNTGSTISNKNTTLKSPLLKFIHNTINRFSKYQNIKWIQIENEPFLRYGPNRLKISEQFLEDEIKYVKNLTDLPLLLTTQGLPTTGLLAEYLKSRNRNIQKLLKHSDILGLNVFPKIRGHILTFKSHIYSAKESAWRYLEKWYKNTRMEEKDCWITELQAEPWGLKDLNLKDPYADKTCNPQMVKQYLERLQRIGFETVLIWGIEFHLACEKEKNDKWIRLIYH